MISRNPSSLTLAWSDGVEPARGCHHPSGMNPVPASWIGSDRITRSAPQRCRSHVQRQDERLRARAPVLPACLEARPVARPAVGQPKAWVPADPRQRDFPRSHRQPDAHTQGGGAAAGAPPAARCTCARCWRSSLRQPSVARGYRCPHLGRLRWWCSAGRLPGRHPAACRSRNSVGVPLPGGAGRPTRRAGRPARRLRRCDRRQAVGGATTGRGRVPEPLSTRPSTVISAQASPAEHARAAASPTTR